MEKHWESGQCRGVTCPQSGSLTSHTRGKWPVVFDSLAMHLIIIKCLFRVSVDQFLVLFHDRLDTLI